MKKQASNVRGHILLFNDGRDSRYYDRRSVPVEIVRLHYQDRSQTALDTAFVIAEIIVEDISAPDVSCFAHCLDPFMS